MPREALQSRSFPVKVKCQVTHALGRQGHQWVHQRRPGFLKERP